MRTRATNRCFGRVKQVRAGENRLYCVGRESIHTSSTPTRTACCKSAPSSSRATAIKPARTRRRARALAQRSLCRPCGSPSLCTIARRRYLLMLGKHHVSTVAGQRRSQRTPPSCAASRISQTRVVGNGAAPSVLMGHNKNPRPTKRRLVFVARHDRHLQPLRRWLELGASLEREGCSALRF